MAHYRLLQAPPSSFLPVLALVLAVAHSAAAAQEPEPVAVRGLVVAEDGGQPLAGAWVELGSSDRGVLTDHEGRFRLGDIPPGPALLIVERLGYATGLVPFQAGPDSLSTLTVRLTPKPVLLEGLRVVFDRFERRRNATPVSVRYFDESDLLRATQGDVVRFLRSRAGLFVTPCYSTRIVSNLCLWRRGQRIVPSVYIDERRAFGLHELRHYDPSDFYMIEVYSRGAHIRAYTRWFMAHAADRRLHPIPLSW
ncbi:MAG: carboxypeptidase regulatory-like domain-containing protein [Longimicrobiales bacterium]